MDTIGDLGTQFTPRVWANFMEKLGVTVSLTSGYHPEYNEKVERDNQEVVHFLREFCLESQGGLVTISPLGCVHPALPAPVCNALDLLPMHARLPTTLVSLEYHSHRHTHSG